MYIKECQLKVQWVGFSGICGCGLLQTEYPSSLPLPFQVCRRTCGGHETHKSPFSEPVCGLLVCQPVCVVKPQCFFVVCFVAN